MQFFFSYIHQVLLMSIFCELHNNIITIDSIRKFLAFIILHTVLYFNSAMEWTLCIDVSGWLEFPFWQCFPFVKSVDVQKCVLLPNFIMMMKKKTSWETSNHCYNEIDMGKHRFRSTSSIAWESFWKFDPLRCNVKKEKEKNLKIIDIALGT